MLERIQKAQIVLLIVGLVGVFFGLTARIFRWLPLMGEEMYQEPLALSYGSWVFLTAGILCLVMVAVLWVTEKDVAESLRAYTEKLEILESKVKKLEKEAGNSRNEESD